jgi:hypothetical protein
VKGASQGNANGTPVELGTLGRPGKAVLPPPGELFPFIPGQYARGTGSGSRHVGGDPGAELHVEGVVGRTLVCRGSGEQYQAWLCRFVVRVGAGRKSPEAGDIEDDQVLRDDARLYDRGAVYGADDPGQAAASPSRLAVSSLWCCDWPTSACLRGAAAGIPMSVFRSYGVSGMMTTRRVLRPGSGRCSPGGCSREPG